MSDYTEEEVQQELASVLGESVEDGDYQMEDEGGDPSQLDHLLNEMENYATAYPTNTTLPPPPPPIDPQRLAELEGVQPEYSMEYATVYPSTEAADAAESGAADEVDQSWEVPDLQAHLAGVDTSEYAPPPPPGPQWQAARPQQAGQQPGQPQQTWQRATPRGPGTGQ